jgi:hypothetical protein
MRSFLDIVNDMLAASRKGDVIMKHIYMLEMESVEPDFADTLDLIDY